VRHYYQEAQRFVIVAIWGLLIAGCITILPSKVDAAGSLSQAFTTTDSSSVAGTLVSLKPGTTNAIEKATSSNASQLLGVVGGKPLVALGETGKEAQVVVSGLTPTLVSNVNGDIKVGDKITASPIQGIGMKAVASSEVVGTAESSLDNNVIATRQIKDDTGRATSVKIGIIAVQVNVAFYTAQQSTFNDFVPPFLVNLASTIAGKEISPIRVLVSSATLFVGFVVAGVMLQAGVRAGIISLGRNPLASKILRRGLLDVLITSFGLLVLTVIAFYLLLTT